MFKEIIIRQWNKVRNNSFIKSILTLSAGVVVSQSIALISTPIVSRIYDPEILGDFAIITSNASIIGVIACLGLMTAIMLAKEDDEAKGLCRLIASCIIGLATILLIIALVISSKWQMFYVNLDYKIACLILWLFVVLTNISSVLYSYVNRQKLYKVLFWNPTIGTVTNASVSIGLGILGCGLWGYACGNLLALVLNIIHMLRYVNPFIGEIDNKYNVISLLKKHKDFPLYQLPANFIGTFSQQLPVQLIKRFFGSAILGSYSMCLTVLGVPTKFLAAPANRVYYQEATSRYNKGEDIGEFSYKILETNIRLAIIPISILIIFGKPLFGFVLGEKWLQAGSFASILGIYQLVLFCSNILSGSLTIIGKQKVNLCISIVSIIINLFSFTFGYYFFKDIYKVLIIYSLMSTFTYIFSNGFFLVKTGISINKYLKFIATYIICPTIISLILRYFLILMNFFSL